MMSDGRNTQQTPAERNRAILQKTQYNYIFIPGSSVFHTRSCPCILRAKSLEGSVYYITASRDRRPCKRCKPEPDIQAGICPDQNLGEKKKPGPEVNYGEIIKARLLGGKVIEVRRGNIVGFCHNLTHPGKLTKALLESHGCLSKQCPFLEKYEEVPFWIERNNRQRARNRAKQHKKEKKAILRAEAESMAELRIAFQQYADSTSSGMDIIRVERTNHHTYTVFYVSDNRFADGNRFPSFLDALKENYKRRRIILRHIKDVDGHFVTRDEFYSRKR